MTAGHALLSQVRTRLVDAYVAQLEFRLGLSGKYGRAIGVTREKREPPIIVSMTTTPSRIQLVHLSIESLMRQHLRPDLITLWLSDQFEHRIPPALERLRTRGLEIEFRRDIGPHTKEIYALREYPDALLVTADDDLLYPQNWLEELYAAYGAMPDAIHCHMARVMTIGNDGKLCAYRSWPVVHRSRCNSLRIFPLTGHGALFPPGCLHQDATNEELLVRLSPRNDDVWLKAMSLLKSVPCQVTSGKHGRILTVRQSQGGNLYSENTTRNDEYLRAVFGHYDLGSRLESW